MLANYKGGIHLKKLVTILLAGLMCGAILAGCGNSEDPKQVLQGYSGNESYSDGDETSTQQDFSIYIYDKSYDSKFSKDENYIKVTSKNKEDITGYFQDFDTWGTTSSFSDNYNFKTDMITDGDYYCIADEKVNISSVGQRKAVKIYHEYSVYYYDTESHTLYYIHNDLNES